MRKQPIVLAAAVAVAGLAALGTVVAQQPGGGYTPPKVVPAGGAQPAPVRPYADWTASPTMSSPAAGLGAAPGARPQPQPGATYPTNAQTQNASYPPPGGTAVRPRPGVAGASGSAVRPAGAFDVPPPSMDFPAPGMTPAPTRPLPPPSLSVEPGDSKFPVSSSPPLVPVPPPSGLAPPAVPPPLPSTPVIPTPGENPKPLPFPPLTATPPALPPGTGSVAAPAINAPLPNKVAQSVTVDAVCPESVVFGTECRYEIVVRNAGNVAVQNVRIEDELPAGARYVGSDPPAELNGDKLVWAVGSLDANAVKRIAVRVRPSEEGELRSRATVSYTAAVEVKTKVTRPRIAVTVVCPEQARAGEDPVFKIRVTNSGTGPAEKMVLQAVLSDGLEFRGADGKPIEGRDRPLETKLAALPAGESRSVELPLWALKAGLQSCQVVVTAEGSADATAKAAVNIVEPQLQVAQAGPAKCLVRGEPTYEITLANPGTAATDSITVRSLLPDGFDFVQASDSGSFNPTTREVSWKLNGLPAGGTKAVAVKLRAGAAGDVALRTVAVAAPEAGVLAPAGAGLRSGRAIEAKADTAIKAEGVAALRFDVAGLENPVEVGKEAVYEIRIVNQGTGACTNVQIMAALADGTTYTSSNGPTTAKATGQTLVFEPIPTLAVKGETVYRVRVRGAAAGDQRFRVQLTCDQVRTPVVKEESTRFYKE